MKKRVLLFLLLLVFSAGERVFAVENQQSTVITAPLDGRPISLEYLKNLTDLYGDKFIASDKGDLDLFTQYNTWMNRFANSELIRGDLKNKIANNNLPNTTVIINTSSYITNGLIGGRCYKNYKDYEKALEELRELTSEYSEPYYYVNTNMPRTLPEDRENEFWPDAVKVKGLGYFYLQSKKDSLDYEKFSKQYSLVSPSQLLMEWSYVENKANEHGFFSLAPWEVNFINYFNITYKAEEKYRIYIDQYQMVYKNAANIIKKVIDMNIEGKIDQVVVSVDDFQLPDFIVSINKSSALDKSWIPKENGNPIKFSWARTYLQTDAQSVYNYHKYLVGAEEFTKALASSSKNINYIYGVDEVPQMIYARDLVRRTGLSTNFEKPIFNYNLNIKESQNHIGIYDMVTTQTALDNAINFVTRPQDNEIIKTDKPFKLYINKYLEKRVNIDKGNSDMLIQDMFASYNAGYNIGLIEFYSFEVLQNGSNELFRNLSNPSYLSSLGLNSNSIAQLGCYSSWNTVGNAAGLGIAHAQVFGISEQLTTDPNKTALSQSKVLAQHLLEDAIYGVQLKKLPTQGKYNMTNLQSMTMESGLFQELHNSQMLNNFKDTYLNIKDEWIKIEHFKINKSGFPWLRAYDVYIDVEFLSAAQST